MNDMQQKTSSKVQATEDVEESTTPQIELSKLNERASILFEAFEKICKRLEPILLPMNVDRDDDFDTKNNSEDSLIVQDLKSLNTRLYNLQYFMQQLPNYIQL